MLDHVVYVIKVVSDVTRLHHVSCVSVLNIVSKLQYLSILTWCRGYPDPEGGSPSARPFHCTPVGLTVAISPNAGDSGT